jgi:hypothetical protein
MVVLRLLEVAVRVSLRVQAPFVPVFAAAANSLFPGMRLRALAVFWQCRVVVFQERKGISNFGTLRLSQLRLAFLSKKSTRQNDVRRS